ncbi:MAG: metallophosphoesterase family protein [Candidatus Neomarinimicrobiota bacterium]
MRIAIIADIHGNLSAFQAVLADIEKQKIDRIVNLGDFIGYGPEPEAVAQILQERQIPSILGNHEVALTDDAVLNSFTENAFDSLKITRDLVSHQTMVYIQTLPAFLTFNNLRFVHGAPPESTNDYITFYRLFELHAAIAATPEWLTFVGHTHMLGIYESDGREITIGILKKGARRLKRHSKYIINVGSIGQPRDRDRTAKYVIFDDAANEVEVHYVAYDIQRTIRLIWEIGLPEQNAQRLL